DNAVKEFCPRRTNAPMSTHERCNDPVLRSGARRASTRQPSSLSTRSGESREQKRLAKTVAMADDIPELVTGFVSVSNASSTSNAQLAAARRTPAGGSEAPPTTA